MKNIFKKIKKYLTKTKEAITIGKIVYNPIILELDFKKLEVVIVNRHNREQKIALNHGDYVKAELIAEQRPYKFKVLFNRIGSNNPYYLVRLDKNRGRFRVLDFKYICEK